MSASDPAYDVSKVKALAELVNATLESRAYIDTKLLFPSVNWSYLITDQIKNNPNHSKPTETIYKNDENILRVMNELVLSIDKNRSRQKSLNDTLTVRDRQIEELSQRVVTLEKRLAATEHRSRDSQIDHTALMKRIFHLSQANKLQSKDIKSLTTANKDLQAKFRVELKRKNLAISNLKNKLVEKRTLSSTIEYGIPVTPSSSQPSTINLGGGGGGEDSNEGIYNNTPTIDNSINTGITFTNPELINLQHNDNSNTSNDNTSEYIKSLTMIIESIAGENYKLTKFIQHVKNYLSMVNSQMTTYKGVELDLGIPNPSETIDLKQINDAIDGSVIQKFYNEIDNAEVVQLPLVNEFYKLYHNLKQVLELMANVGIDSDAQKVIDDLRSDLKVTKDCLQDSLEMNEKWKKLARNKEGT
ncbi:hypothetical protein KGF57_002549 [Candida theae]|uniref:Autophagy-related protein 25 n=1 Tax=Candida theae TaxID=1198502 RepID=A0AAD5BEK5_9ASCO|nr:uncharacterized protein KGF57_002549 [Candida theae]KAI5958194.1 hypothetical protein KGF57_002549 [Candida theae]